jgi:hypothetical protein
MLAQVRTLKDCQVEELLAIVLFEARPEVRDELRKLIAEDGPLVGGVDEFVLFCA